MRPLFLAYLAPLVLLGLSCARPTPTAIVRLERPERSSSEPSADPSTPATAPSAPSADRRIRLSGAINEVLGFSFTVDPETDLPMPSIRMSGFEAAGGTPSLRLEAFRMHEVQTPRLPGWHIRSIPPNRRLARTPDVLVPVEAPRGGLRETIRAGEPSRFWVDLHIQKGTPPGRYAGAIELVVGDARVAAVDVELSVWPFVLPDEAGFPAIAEVDHRALIRATNGADAPTDYWLDSPNAEAVTRSLFDALRLLESHGLTPVLPHFKPKAAPDGRGDVQVNWGLFDAVIGPLMDGSAFDDRVGLRVNYLPLEDAFTTPENGVAESAFARKYVARYVAHYKEKGWFDRAYAALPIEATYARAADRVAELVPLYDAASAGEIRVATRLFPQNMEPYGWVGFRPFTEAGGVDVWFPPAQFFDARRMDEEKDRGRAAWFSVDRPPYSGSISIHADESSTRALSWQTQAAQVAALHLGPIDDWPHPTEAATPEACLQHNPNTLIYPGAAFGLSSPVPSLRLKWLRRAMQDAAYARLLREHGLEHVTHALSTALVSYVGADAYRTHYADAKPIGWPAEAAAFELAREIMGDELARVVGGAPAERDVERFSRSAAWQRLLRETRNVRLEIDGCRVRRVQTVSGSGAEINCTLSAYNDRRTALAGELRWTADNPGIRADSGKRMEGAVPGGARRVSLSAKTSASALSQSDENRFKFTLATNDGQSYENVERLAYVVAPLAKTPLRIDGDLADWPPRAVNVADGFRLISPDDPMAPTGRQPAAKTTAFVLRDDANLYVAVQCQASGGGTDVSQKRLVYDDLIPRGGDLVELLFDPLNLGSRSPADLYHIVLQRSGSDFAEKGVGLTPPVGLRQVWPVDLDVAIRRSADQWVAEVRIPLDTFGTTIPRAEFWGFNITRYDAANEEFSTWSGAVGNAYDPVSLGNLYLP